MDLKHRNHHELKIKPEYFKDVQEGLKKFELRKNDRDFRVGDTVVLIEFAEGFSTGLYWDLEIKYILHGGEYGLDEGYCIFGW